MDPLALSLLLEFRADPCDDRRLVLCDRLEETDDPRHHGLRQATPRQTCRVMPSASAGPLARDFAGPLGPLLVEVSGRVRDFRLAGVAAPDCVATPLAVRLCLPSGIVAWEYFMSPRTSLVYQPPARVVALAFDRGIRLEVEGDGGVRFDIPVLAPGNTSVCDALLFGTAAAFWRSFVDDFFPEHRPQPPVASFVAPRRGRDPFRPA